MTRVARRRYVEQVRFTAKEHHHILQAAEVLRMSVEDYILYELGLKEPPKRRRQPPPECESDTPRHLRIVNCE